MFRAPGSVVRDPIRVDPCSCVADRSVLIRGHDRGSAVANG